MCESESEFGSKSRFGAFLAGFGFSFRARKPKSTFGLKKMDSDAYNHWTSCISGYHYTQVGGSEAFCAGVVIVRCWWGLLETPPPLHATTYLHLLSKQGIVTEGRYTLIAVTYYKGAKSRNKHFFCLFTCTHIKLQFSDQEILYDRNLTQNVGRQCNY